WAAQIVAEVIKKDFSLPTKVKLPNDVFIDTKKVAGVLVEMRAQKGARHFAILGIGINVNHRVEDFPPELHPRATSIALMTNRPVNRQQLAISLLRDLDKTYHQLVSGL